MLSQLASVVAWGRPGEVSNEAFPEGLLVFPGAEERRWRGLRISTSELGLLASQQRVPRPSSQSSGSVNRH